MFESQFELVNGTMDYLKSMMLPELSEPSRVPDEVVATSALFKSPQVVENLPYSGRWSATDNRTLPLDGPGESTVLVCPSVFGGIWHTLGESTEILPSQSADLLRPSLVENTTISVGVNGRRYIGHALRGGDVGCIPRKGSLNQPTFEITLDSEGVDTQIGFSLYSPSSRGTARLVDVTFWTRRVGNTNFASNTVTVNVKDGYGYLSINELNLVPIDAWRISIDDAADDWRFTFGADVDSALPTPIIRFEANSACAYRVRDVDQLLGLQQTSSIRPAALSALVTWMGSTLENGGNIAVARLPAGRSFLSAPSGDYYGYLSQLPIYAGDYPLKEGAYSWWCPDSEQEYFFQPYSTYRCDDLAEVQTLAFSMRRDEVNQTVRLRIDTVFEALTRSVQYVSEVGPTSPEFPRMLAVAKTLPAVSINEEHVGFFKRIFGKAKNWLKQPANWQKILGGAMKLLVPGI
jgi:hypothetical protein